MLCTWHTLVKLNFSHLKTHSEWYTTIDPLPLSDDRSQLRNHNDSSTNTSSHSFTSQRNEGDVCTETVSQPLVPPIHLPGVHPYYCSHWLSLLVSMQTLSWSTLHWSTTPLTSRLRSRKGVNICSCRRPRQPTDGQQHRGRELEPLARNSGGKDRQKMRRGRRREAVVAVCRGGGVK